MPAFINGLLAIEKLNPTYKEGGSGKNGTCDCIGLAVGAFREAGFVMPGIHGSNYAARYGVEGLTPYVSDSQLIPGMWIFTGKEPGNTSNRLPARYQPGKQHDNGDYRDYSHVYFVLTTNPLVIIHCTQDGTTNGVTRISKVRKSRFFAYSKYIDYGQKGDVPNVTHPTQTYPVLRKGKKGEDVRQLQQLLITAGYSVGNAGADGVFGSGTHNALWQLQKEHNLGVDGIAGKATWAKLAELNSTGSGVNPPISGGDDIEGDYANLHILDLPKTELIKLRSEWEAKGYRTELSYG